ncbi:MAG: hypothetical protein HYW95_01850 [Candidatus Wildermuthbacteria bacterium]|nr:hypothetical protein [Candidatus Wildermuthbacteria bacterium]
MKTLKIFTIAVVVCAGFVVPAFQSLAQAKSSYILLSKYYVFPEEQVTVRGYGFGRNELVEVRVGTMTQIAQADARGNFVSPHFVVPFQDINSTLNILAQGRISGIRETAKLVVGSFYPQVVPSSYFVKPGGSVSFTGRNFAPNEEVRVERQGNFFMLAKTNSSGGFVARELDLPYREGILDYSFIGQNSKTQARVTLKFDDTVPFLLLNKYFGNPGTQLQLTGHGFGVQERVEIFFEGQFLGSTVSRPEGIFVFATEIPLLGPRGQGMFFAHGLDTNRTARAWFTVTSPNPTESELTASLGQSLDTISKTLRSLLQLLNQNF